MLLVTDKPPMHGMVTKLPDEDAKLYILWDVILYELNLSNPAAGFANLGTAGIPSEEKLILSFGPELAYIVFRLSTDLYKFDPVSKTFSNLGAVAGYPGRAGIHKTALISWSYLPLNC